MKVKLVIRLLTATGDLIAWSAVQGEARGDGRLWAATRFEGIAEMDGEAVTLSVHWPDVHIEVRSALPSPVRVQAGVPIAISFTGPLIIVGTPPECLAPVTVRAPITVDPASAAMGVVTHS